MISKSLCQKSLKKFAASVAFVKLSNQKLRKNAVTFLFLCFVPSIWQKKVIWELFSKWIAPLNAIDCEKFSELWFCDYLTGAYQMLPVPGQYPSPFPKPPAISSPVPTEAIVQASTMPPFIEHDQQVTPLWKLSSFNRKKNPCYEWATRKKFCEEISIVYSINFFATRCAVGTRATWAKFTKIELWIMVSALLPTGKIGVLGMSRSEVKVACLQKANEDYKCCIYHLLVSLFPHYFRRKWPCLIPLWCPRKRQLGKEA